MDITVSLDTILNFLHSFSLTADNKKWIADHLYEEAKAEEKDNRELTPTEEKFIKRAMLGHQQIQEGKCKECSKCWKKDTNRTINKFYEHKKMLSIHNDKNARFVCHTKTEHFWCNGFSL